MSAQEGAFERRVRKLRRKHRRLTGGYSLSVDGSGLVHLRPQRAKGLSPILLLLIVLGIGVAFKSVVLANEGPSRYAERLAPLQSGTVLERAGAWALEPGVFTQAGAKLLAGVLR